MGVLSSVGNSVISSISGEDNEIFPTFSLQAECWRLSKMILLEGGLSNVIMINCHHFTLKHALRIFLSKKPKSNNQSFPLGDTFIGAS